MALKEGDHYITVTFIIRPEDGQFAAYCKELGTATCGDTFQEAFDNIIEAVEVDLGSLEELGERPRFFQERKIKLRRYQKRSREPALQRPVYRGGFTTARDIPVPVTG